MNSFLENKLKNEIRACSFFSVALDESTDVADVAQLMIYCRYVNEKFELNEEMLDLCSLHDSTKGKDIFEVVILVLKTFDDSNLTKLSAICTDGAPAMVIRKDGLVGQFSKNGFEVSNFYCVIHREVFCSKMCNIPDTMNILVKIVNKIRGGHISLNHWCFKNFIDEFGLHYNDLLMHTEVGWLSRGKFSNFLYFFY